MKSPVMVLLILASILATSGLAAPDLTIQRTGPGQMALEWIGTGVMERSDNPSGPWEPMFGATSGWTFPPTRDREFFRLSGFGNGGFEQGPEVGWIQYPAPMIYTAEQMGLVPYAGQYAARLG